MTLIRLKLRIDRLLSAVDETTILNSVAAILALLSVMLVCFVFTPVPSAYGAFEVTGHFAGSTGAPTEPIEEEVQLGGTGGMAVNYTGSGGVPAGTVYAATKGSGGEAVRVAMYTPKVNSTTFQIELQFKLSWQVTELGGAFKRCGPGLPEKCQARFKGLAGNVDVDVDQATGNVYVLDGEIFQAGSKMVVVYGPEGEAEITRFGELAPVGSKTSETPEKIHRSNAPGGLAVNAAGQVYVFDVNFFDGPSYRLMKFRPKVPGVFTEYEYAGTAEDVGAGAVGVGGEAPEEPVADAGGNIYVAPGGSRIEMYDPSSPDDPPVCEYFFEKGGITAITVNPATGEPFFFSYKPPKRIYQLGPCNPATGKFEGSKGEAIVGETIVSPERDDLWGLAFDPVAKFTPGRPAGVLYGGAPAPVPSSGLGPGEPGKTSLGYIISPPEEVPPLVKSTSTLRVLERSARLQATIDPKGSKTHFLFQYMSEADYVAAGESFEGTPLPTEAPAGGGFLANSTGAQGVAATPTGLAPDTDYVYQVVATSNCAPGEPGKVCKDEGEVESFHTYPAEAPGLHDGRVFELVSPPQKNGGQVLPAEPGISSCGSESECKPGESYAHFPMQSTPGGNAVVFEGTSFAPGTGVTLGNSYIARRDPNLGWQSVNLTPALIGNAGGFQAFDGALGEALFAQFGSPLNPAAPPEYTNLYAQPTGNPLAVTPLLTTPPPNRSKIGLEEFRLTYVGASADLSRVFFEANDVLTAEVPTVAPEPEDGGPAKFNLYEWEAATGALRLVNVLPGNTTTEAGVSIGVPSANAVSADGSRVFFSDEAGQLYVREGATTTKEIPDAGEFLSAATDGSKVLLTNGHLYDLGTGLTADLSGGVAGFEGIAGQSDNLSKVYFVDTAVLTGEEVNPEGAKAQAGKPNLYAWSEKGPTTRYVGTLLPGDNTGINRARSRTWAGLPSQRTAEASPSGRYLAFLTQASVTGIDSTGPCQSTSGGIVEAPCPEVFLYDSEPNSGSPRLYCASCNRSGAAPLGISALRLIRFGDVLPQPRYLLDSGRLYFDSQDSLNQFDTNDGVEDVYEFEPNGGGGGTAPCTREGGCVTLISSGHDAYDANLLALDASGANVFLTTRNRLNPADTDEMIDLYDAREGGGFPFESQLPQGSCQGEGCQLPAAAPPPPPPSSENPGGEGENAKPVKCKKGQVKKNGKCVKKHKPKKNGGKNKKGGKAKRGGAK